MLKASIRKFLESSIYFLLGKPLGALSGKEPDGTPVKAGDFLKAFQSSLLGLGLRFLAGPMRVFIPEAKWKASCSVVNRFIDYHVDTVLKDKHKALLNLQPGHRSLLQCLVEQTDDKVEIRNHIIQGMMAAQDTTSVLISNTLFLLSRNQTAWDGLQQEVLDLDSPQLTFDRLKSMSLLRNILYECTR